MKYTFTFEALGQTFIGHAEAELYIKSNLKIGTGCTLKRNGKEIMEYINCNGTVTARKIKEW